MSVPHPSQNESYWLQHPFRGQDATAANLRAQQQTSKGLGHSTAQRAQRGSNERLAEGLTSSSLHPTLLWDKAAFKNSTRSPAARAGKAG